jgi:hypothetical protein
MHYQTNKGKLYGISSVVRKISLYMTFSFNVGTSNRRYRLSVSRSYSYIGLLVAAGFGCVKRQQQAIKMYINKDNINTVQQNDTVSGSLHLRFTKLQLYNPNQITVRLYIKAALL